MKTITTLEKLLISNEMKENVVTHIQFTGRKNQTLCMSGNRNDTDQHGNVLAQSQTIAEGMLPVNCPDCTAMWQSCHEFEQSDFTSCN